MRVLLTGAAGFIGSRVVGAGRRRATRSSRVDAMLAAAHGPDAELPDGVRRVDVRDAAALAPLLPGVDVVCHQAAVVGAGVDAADAPAYGSHNDYGTTVLLAEMFAAGCQRLVLASSMVVYGQGRYECPEHGLVDPLPRTRADLDAGVFEHRCPVGGEQLQLAAGRRGRAAAAAQPVRGEQDRAGALRAGVGGGDRRLGASRCATTTSTARTCRATPRIPGWPRSSGRRSKRARRQGFSRTAARCATSSTSTTSPRPTSPRSSAKPGGFAAFNVCSGRPVSILDVATRLCDARGGVGAGGHRSVPQRRRPPHRRRPARAAELLGFRAAIDPADGLREFAFAPLRG